MLEDVDDVLDLVVITAHAARDPEWAKQNAALAAYADAQLQRRLPGALMRVSKRLERSQS